MGHNILQMYEFALKKKHTISSVHFNFMKSLLEALIMKRLDSYDDVLGNHIQGNLREPLTLVNSFPPGGSPLYWNLHKSHFSIQIC